MGKALRRDFPKYLAILNLNNEIYEVKTYATKEQMVKYTTDFARFSYIIEQYEHNGQDYIKI